MIIMIIMLAQVSEGVKLSFAAGTPRDQRDAAVSYDHGTILLDAS